MQGTELQRFLVEAIRQHMAESPLSSLKDIDGSPLWEEPLVGFADADDALFGLYKSVVGEFHLTPREALAAGSAPGEGGQPADFPQVGVVSWILPIARATRESNRKMTEGPSRRWNHTRFQGEDSNDSLRRHLVALLEGQGHVAVAPMLLPSFTTHNLANGPASNWSERHVAHAAGLGTFSLSDGLITAKGIAHRCGSVVVNAAFVPSARSYTHHLEYCPYPTDGSCGACIQRCPAGAISASGHDKWKCREYMQATILDWAKKPGYLGSYPGCGLCQTKVPCESRIPRRAAKPGA